MKLFRIEAQKMNYIDNVMNLTVYGVQSGGHCLSKAFCILLVGKI